MPICFSHFWFFCFVLLFILVSLNKTSFAYLHLRDNIEDFVQAEQTFHKLVCEIHLQHSANVNGVLKVAEKKPLLYIILNDP